MRLLSLRLATALATSTAYGYIKDQLLVQTMPLHGAYNVRYCTGQASAVPRGSLHSIAPSASSTSPSICTLNPCSLTPNFIPSDSEHEKVNTFIVFMSSTGQATPSTFDFQLIFDAALVDYTKITGTDLSKTPFATAVQQSNSPEAVLELLHEREKSFKEYREGNRKLISCLTPAVKVFRALSNVLGNAVNQVSRALPCHPVILLTPPRQIPFPPANALFAAFDTLLAVRPFSMFFYLFLCDERVFQAADGVTLSYYALLELFECLASFLKRLEIYTTIPPTPILTDAVVKIMVQLLSVLALASKQIKQGRLSKCAFMYTLFVAQCAAEKFGKKLLGESEIETTLQRLDRLTKDEAQGTVAQTLGVVHGLVGSVKTVMESA